MEMNTARLIEIADELEGTTDSVSDEAAAEFGMTPRELELMLMRSPTNIAQCAGCAYWWSINELLDDLCPDCRGDE